VAFASRANDDPPEIFSGGFLCGVRLAISGTHYLIVCVKVAQGAHIDGENVPPLLQACIEYLICIGRLDGMLMSLYCVAFPASSVCGK
jgi:hypothetical protein